MNVLRKLTLAMLLLLSLHQSECSEYDCSDQFCATYVEQNDCLPLGDACRIQNSTYSGEVFPAEVPCGCCEVCLEHLKEGDYCTIGSPDITPPLMVCGPGLYCTGKDESEGSTCQKMDHTPCFKDQIQYDTKKDVQKVGRFMQRPICDGDGNYNPVKCHLNQTCFCVNDNGERIFGEDVYSRITELTMKCECSRMNDKFSRFKAMKYPAATSRCLDDGSFDPLQCMGDHCMCVERSSGYPDSDNYNMTNIAYSALPCYNRVFHLDYKYLHDCEESLFVLSQQIAKSEAEEYTLVDLNEPRCNPDGWFHPVQSNKTHVYCADKYGFRIEDFAVPKSDSSKDIIDCNCARTTYLLKRNRIARLPKCCPNGNFETVQCHDNICYCVDKNGLQTEIEVEAANVSTLTCYNNGIYC